jgi:tRNA nucleotidyltransferase (CCA-adding enzyme)
MTRPLPRPVRIYRVGGSVRDELLGLPPGDRDWVVVGATPEIMLASGYRPVGKDFPVFLHPETQEEYALARTERKHGRGYRGFEFFATPDVTLDDDLARRDLTINAMARAPDGVLIDPHGGERDLRAGVLRHVSPAFAEDPLRVLRVARFAARFGFTIADTTLALMRDIVARGELDTLASERVFAELARGLNEAHPSRMLAALRSCGALAALIPEVDALYAVRSDDDDAGTYTERALDWSAQQRHALPVRYAALTQELDRLAGKGSSTPSSPRKPPARRAEPVGAQVSTRTGVARAEAVSARLKVPVDCRDAARLAARWHRKVARAETLPPAQLLDLIGDADALRRPERLDTLVAAAAAHVAAGARGSPLPAIDHSARLLREALAVVRNVDAAAIAQATIARAARGSAAAGAHGERIQSALRDARLSALRAWKRSAA